MILDGLADPWVIFDELESGACRIEARQQQTPPLKEVEIVIRSEGSVAREHPAVTQLIKLVRDRDLGVKVSTPGNEGR